MTANDKLMMVGSGHRAAVLVEVLAATPGKAKKRILLREWFNSCEAIFPQREALRDEFRLAGFVTDSTDAPDVPCTVYRAAYADDDTQGALSWTTSRETAEFFARHHTSIRAQFLGLYRDDVPMLIFQGTCTEMLGYLAERGESEVIVGTVEDVEAIAELRTVEVEA